MPGRLERDDLFDNSRELIKQKHSRKACIRNLKEDLDFQLHNRKEWYKICLTLEIYQLLTACFAVATLY